jgi:ABC-type sugar transport system ATPase subunit
MTLPSSEEGSPLLALRDIRKSFSGVEVLHGVDLTLRAGEVRALLGENGAGKSTLVKILSGDLARDRGEVLLDGRPVELRSPREAEAHGVRLIHQELSYAPDLSVAENVLMGRLPRRSGPAGAFGVVDWPEAYRQASEALAMLKADIDPREMVGRLSVGERQIVEIARALSGAARILVFDEPTAALNARETRSLFETIATLRARGVGMIYISHRLDEVEEIAQTVTVLRDGSVAGDAAIADLSRRDIVHMMVGREIGTAGEGVGAATSSEPGQPVLEVDGLTRRGQFERVGFSVRAGEVVGLYGLLGAGQTEVVRALFGVPPADAGTVRVAGRAVRVRSPQEARRAGIGLVPDDRKVDGLVIGMSVAENITLGNWRRVARGGVLQPRHQRECAEQWVGRLRVRAPGGHAQPVGTLSGGNQQKVVLARWLEAGTRVLLLAEPTRGVDVGARADIYAVLNELRAKGLALVVVSTDQEEILELCDRTLVFARGRVVATLERAQTSRESLLAAAAGEDRR